MTRQQLFNQIKTNLRHKYFVFIECCKRGIIWRGIIHDLDKFEPHRLKVYAEHFFNPDGSKRDVRDSTGGYDINAQEPVFRDSVAQHVKQNRHHWEHWVVHFGPGTFSVHGKLVHMKESATTMPMDQDSITELFCDWIGAGKAQGTGSPKDFYEAHKDTIVLHPKSRAAIEQLLSEL